MSPGLVQRAAAGGMLLCAVILATSALATVFETGPLVRAVLTGTALGAVAAGVTVWFRLSPLLSWAVMLLGYVAGGLLIGVGIPSGLTTSLRALGAGVVTSWKDLLTLTPPFGDAPGLVVAPWLVSYVAAGIITVVALRCQAWAPMAAIAPLLVLGLSLVVSAEDPVQPVVIGVAVAVLSLLGAAALHTRIAWHRGLSLGVAVALGIGAGFALPALAPQRDRLIVREAIEPPFDPAQYESPLSTFRSYVKDREQVELIVEGDTAGAPIRLAAMDAYNGIVWTTTTSQSGGSGGSDSGEFRRVAGPLETGVGETVLVSVRTGRDFGVWLPTVGQVARFAMSEAQREGLRYNVTTSTAALLPQAGSDSSYTVEAVIPEAVSDADLAEVPVADVELGTVERVPDIVEVLAREWSGPATSPIEMARSLEQRMAGTGWYSDGVDEGAPAGHGADRMTALLESDQMVGNAEQYASAMALMARSLGLPARVVMGFEVAASDGEAVEVVGSDVTAWVEIAFEGHGWIPFYPTPDKSRVPDSAQTTTNPDAQPQVNQPRPTQPPPTQAPTAEPNDVRPLEDDPEIDPAVDPSRGVYLVVGGIGLVLLVLVLPLVAIVVFKLLRRRRRRHASSPRQATEGAWAEVMSTARDIGLDVPANLTRGELVSALGVGQVADRRRGERAVPGEAGTPGAPQVLGPGLPESGLPESGVPGSSSSEASDLMVLATRADAAQFGPFDPDSAHVAQAWHAAESVRGSWFSQLSWWRRFRARTSLASVRIRSRDRAGIRDRGRARRRPRGR